MFHPPPSQVNFLTAWLVQPHHCPTWCFPTTLLLRYQHSAGLPCSVLHSKGGYCLFHLHLKTTIEDDIKVWNCWCSDLPPWYSSQIPTFHATIRWKALCFIYICEGQKLQSILASFVREVPPAWQLVTLHWSRSGPVMVWITVFLYHFSSPTSFVVNY